MTRLVGLASVLLALSSTACSRTHEPVAAGGEDGGPAGRIDAGIGDAGDGPGPRALDSGSHVDEDGVVIAGERCGAPVEPDAPAPPCAWSEETAGTCPSGRPGPTVAFAELDACAEAASAGGSFEQTFRGPFDVRASCEGLHVRSAEVDAEVDFDGSLALAQRYAYFGFVRELRVRATVDERGCTRVVEVGVTRGVDSGSGTLLVFAELPAGLGRVWLDDWILELTWVGPACDTGVWSQCAAFLHSTGERSPAPSLLAPCTTSYVPAEIGGCWDEILLPVVAGPLDCETPVRIAFWFTLTRPLCH